MALNETLTEFRQFVFVPGEQRPHGGEPESGGRGQLRAVPPHQRPLHLGVGRPLPVVAQLPDKGQIGSMKYVWVCGNKGKVLFDI